MVERGIGPLTRFIWILASIGRACRARVGEGVVAEMAQTGNVHQSSLRAAVIQDAAILDQPAHDRPCSTFFGLRLLLLEEPAPC